MRDAGGEFSLLLLFGSLYFLEEERGWGWLEGKVNTATKMKGLPGGGIRYCMEIRSVGIGKVHSKGARNGWI